VLDNQKDSDLYFRGFAHSETVVCKWRRGVLLFGCNKTGAVQQKVCCAGFGDAMAVLQPEVQSNGIKIEVSR
jgi:hypothetical protein